MLGFTRVRPIEEPQEVVLSLPPRSPSLAALALSLLLGASENDPSHRAIDEYVQKQMEKQRIPGLSLAVLRDGKILHMKGYGLANVEHQVPATEDSTYQSGSVGKQFTAAAVLLLVEEKKLELDDPIEKYFPESPDHWKGITVRHLLTHTSGIRNYTGDTGLDYRRDYSNRELFQLAASPPLDFPPGSKWSYSNTGYVLLGLLIEKLTGKFYGDWLEERIFSPLGMETARIISEEDIVPHRAAGYRLVDGVVKNQEWVAPSLNRTADGSLYLTVRDLAKWDAGLRAGRLFQRTSLEAMRESVQLGNGNSYPYGLGWRLGLHRGHTSIGHGGSWQGFRTHIERYDEDGLTVIVLTNLAQAEPEALAYGIAGLYNDDYLPPGLMQAQVDPDPRATARRRQFLEDFGADNGEDRPAMAPGLADVTTPIARESVRASTRDLDSFSFIACDDVQERGLVRNGAPVRELCYYRLATPRKTRYFTFALTASGLVADFGWYSE